MDWAHIFNPGLNQASVTIIHLVKICNTFACSM